MEQARRHTIIELFRVGHKPAQIHKFHPKYPFKSDMRYEETGVMRGKQGKERKPRSDRKCTPRFLMGLKQSIKAAPGVPMSVHAKKKGVSETTIRRAVKSLSMKSYALRKKHLITPEQRQQRLLKSKRILSSLKKGAKQLHFFSSAEKKLRVVD